MMKTNRFLSARPKAAALIEAKGWRLEESATRMEAKGWRLETKKAADRYGVFGWVKNQRDGTVAAVFEGSKENVDSMLGWCNHGPPIAKVLDVDVIWEEYKGEFNGFEITY